MPIGTCLKPPYKFLTGGFMLSGTEEWLMAIEDTILLSRDFTREVGMTAGDARISRRDYNAHLARQDLNRLAMKKLIKMKKTEDAIVIQLTDKAQLSLTKARIKAVDRDLPSREYCMVAFDIPESSRKVRSIFRRFLKQAGFIQSQKSLWISKKDVGPDMIKFIHRLKLEAWVQVYVGRLV